MSLASYDAHRRRMQAIQSMREAQSADDGDLAVQWLAVFGGACLGASVLLVLWMLAWFAPEIVEWTR